MIRNLLWNLFGRPSGPWAVTWKDQTRYVSIVLKQGKRAKRAKVSAVIYDDTKQKCRLLAKRRVKRG